MVIAEFILPMSAIAIYDSQPLVRVSALETADCAASKSGAILSRGTSRAAGSAYYPLGKTTSGREVTANADGDFVRRDAAVCRSLRDTSLAEPFVEAVP